MLLKAVVRNSARRLNIKYHHVRSLSCANRWVFGSFQRFISTESHKMEFKAETKKLLQIVAHSLYKDKEIFVRELISNASDALEKLRFLEAVQQDLVNSKLDADVPLKIAIKVDKDAKTFVIQDTGIGMTREDVIENLGTIAKSGSLAFIEQQGLDKDEQGNAIIGQFGVGFYSSFVVSNKVEVFTRSYNKDKGVHWVSDGMGEFTISEVDELPRGTKIVCHLKDDCSEFCDFNKVKNVCEKFSSFISFPLYMDKEGKDVEITSQKALWLQSDATDEEHTAFFRHLSNTSWGEPFYKFYYKTDAPLSIKSLFYIPQDAPNRMFQAGNNDVGISLYSKRVLIKKSADNIIPKWLFFIKGVVDCDDMPLNVSREEMQNSKLINKLGKTIVLRILKFLQDEAKRDVDKYNTFYNKYSYYLKEGLLDQAHTGGPYKDALETLLRFESSLGEENKLISLDQYIETMKENQKNIYVFCASNRATALASPYMENFKRRERNVLFMYEEIDEFVAMNIQKYKDKKIVAIDSTEDDFEPDLEQLDSSVEIKALTDEQQQKIISFFKEVNPKISSIKFSDRLVDSPAVATGFLSAALRKVMKATMKGSAEGGHSINDLPCSIELNNKHNIIINLHKLIETNRPIAEIVAQQVYDNACIAAGIVDDPRVMLDRLNKLVENVAKYASTVELNVPSQASQEVQESQTVHASQ